MNEEKLLYTVDEVAERLGISTSATRRLIKGNQIIAVTIGRSVRIPRGELTRFIADRFEERKG